MARNDFDADDYGFRRKPVRGSTYDRGGPYRETMSGRDYPGTRGRHDLNYYEYNRGPYSPSGYDDRGYGRHDFDNDFRGPDRADSYDRGLGMGGFQDLRGLNPGGTADYDRESDYGGADFGAGTGPYDQSFDVGRPYDREWTESMAPNYGPSQWRDAGGERDYTPERFGTGVTRPRSERWNVPGPHAGRGPRGYEPETRSNEQIKNEVCERLTRNGMIDASDIAVKVEDNEVTLEGSIDSRRNKRLAEDVAESVQSVRDVHNRLTIKRDQP